MSNMRQPDPDDNLLYKAMVEKNNNRDVNVVLNISLKNNYIYFRMPKVGSTSLSATLKKMKRPSFYKGDKQPSPHGLIDTSLIKPYQLTSKMVNDLLGDRAIRRFIFVRHPFSRALSCYKQFIEGPDAAIRRRGFWQHLFGKDVSADSKPNFDDFLSAALDKPPRAMDKHYKPMTDLSAFEAIDFDFVGKLESMPDDLTKLSELLGLAVASSLETRDQHKTGALNAWRDEVTDDRKRKVIQLYEADFSNFGYEI